ncbi:tRNA-dihydrouridine synthase family protein [Carboxylicivirga sp. M1479]|uniref:tRNA-dihydrouridine synthase family protein n=1 Tax=Carboxylicivirga sp. M1479 TaxID=2594476 RepID=UPI0011774056|nr:tRNA-dihydrouridine synthase family protein [Carboxylicivirga sp. M1479]TRX63185.1 tRNA-dihydrouridine synthase family protein [Carboxylicivirga sp. M1479]
MKFYLAPLQSYTTSFYRLAHALSYGQMDKYFTPFFEDTGILPPAIIPETELLPHLNQGLKVIPQVATNRANFLLDFAQQMKFKGFDEINLNMGCPFPMLVKRQKGGGLLNEPELVKQVLDEYFNSTSPLKLSVKIRIGLDNTSQGEAIVRLLNNFPMQEIIVHPRLVTQKYTGLVDWEFYQHLSTLSKHTLMANGDINSLSDFTQLKQLFPDLQAVMLGRGILTKPGLHQQLLNENEVSDNNQLFDFHSTYYKLVTNHFSDWNRAFNHFSNFWFYPLSHSTESKRLLRKLKKHNKPDLYQLWLAQVQELMNS